MARKVLGYIELVWTCDSCGTRNPGAIRSCTACGAPQPIDVKFEHVDPATFNFIKDEALIRMAQSGPDKHCPYCGTRNLAETPTCVNCGGDLTVGATSRPVGEVIEPAVDPALQTGQAGNERASDIPKKPMPKWIPIVGILLLIICCVFGALYFTRMSKTDQMNATVVQTYWKREINVEVYQSVRKSAWESDIPSGASPYNCELRYHYDSDTPKANSEEVCGEPYTVDTGTGIGEVVQDCHYRVYDEYCSYDVMEWVVIDTLSLDGYNSLAYWPISDSLTNDQRLGDSSESYLITFEAKGKQYPYQTNSYELFQQAATGSHWIIEVNGFGNVTGIKPD